MRAGLLYSAHHACAHCSRFQLRSTAAAGPGPSGARRSDILDGIKQGVLLGAAVAVLVLPLFRAHPVAACSGANAAQARCFPQAARVADFGGEPASDDARQVANWVVASGDNRKLFFVILDKTNTKVFVFEPSGKLRSATPVLIGAARGDDSVDGIGGRPIAQVQPQERTTPAGRFVAEPGRNAQARTWSGSTTTRPCPCTACARRAQRAPAGAPGIAHHRGQPHFLRLHQHAGGVF
jgi:hypothetical protein